MTRRKGRRGGTEPVKRPVDYRNLRNPFPPLPAFPESRITEMHEAALDVLSRLGIKVLLPEARRILADAGAIVDEATEMVCFPRDLVLTSLDKAPRSITIKAPSPKRDISLELGRLVFQPGAGCPHATDRDRGRRPGSLRDFVELVQLTQQFEALHMVPPLVEPQDSPTHRRHYDTLRAQLLNSDKVPFIFSRGTPQVEDSFEMMCLYSGLSRLEFEAQPRCYTIINTNSPRQIDIPMAQGLIDFARAGQVAIITPFTLMGAMAPVTVEGALVLSHAEALAAITLSQLARSGAPVCYGTFTSNVDMKSGAPAFGTPEQVRASLGAGQLARLIGLPWRCAAGSAANLNDAQAAHETQISGWGAFLAGATVVIHAAGWLEGGLTVSYEKLITDMDMVNTFAELCQQIDTDPAQLALDAIEEVAPGGHFFGAAHTMERYQTAFFDPLAFDWSNFGSWTEAGSQSSDERATRIWKGMLAGFQPPPSDAERVAALDAFIDRRISEGGAAPIS